MNYVNFKNVICIIIIIVSNYYEHAVRSNMNKISRKY